MMAFAPSQNTALADAEGHSGSSGRPPLALLPNREQQCQFFVVGHGIDTVGFTFSGVGLESLAPLYAQPSYDTHTGEVVPLVHRGGRPWLVHPTAGVETTYAVTPRGQRLVRVEGRLAALAAADRGAERLADVGILGNAERVVRGLMKRMGIEVPGTASTGVHRIDLAVDVQFDERRAGLSFLGALDTLDLPHCKRIRATAKASSVCESVTWRNGGGIVLRAYDKGYDRIREDAQRGQRIRIETQERLRAASRPHPSALAGSALAHLYGRRFKVWNLDDLVVTPPMQAYYILKDRIGKPIPGRTKAGSQKLLTDLVAEHRLGALARLMYEGDAAWPSKRTAQSRRRDLRALGIIVDETAEAVVPMGDVIVAATAAWGTA